MYYQAYNTISDTSNADRYDSPHDFLAIHHVAEPPHTPCVRAPGKVKWARRGYSCSSEQRPAAIPPYLLHDRLLPSGDRAGNPLSHVL